MNRHFTCTGFLVQGNKTLLLWHPRLRMWVPPGGHLEPDEDPVTAVLREIREETGLEVCPMPSDQSLGIDYPRDLPAPVTILLENSFETGERHQHVDFIYFCMLLAEPPALTDDDSHLTWVDEDQLRRNEPLSLGDGRSAAIAEDVRLLALRAIARSRESGG